jgi:tRNA uridine 5-carbamoylmethylation protein Kti12
MTQSIYLLLTGLPAAGKSTIAGRLFESWREPKPMILSTDDYIEAIATGKSSTYSAEFHANIKAAESYVSNLREGSLRAGADIIHDQTNLTTKSRAKRLNDVPKKYYRVCLVVGASEEARQQRLISRPGKVIPPEIDAQMRKSWQDPTFAEGWDDIIYDWNWATGLFPFLSTQHLAET